MPIMRNPFRKQDENVRPATYGVERGVNGATAKPIDIKEREPTEYKLSEINDSGVFVPPSPPERKSFWTTSSSRSTTSSKSNHRSVFNENEPFNISRESFDSYRRSFDISARSAVTQPSADATRPRASLDSRTFLPPAPRSSNSFHRPLQVPGTQKEEELEEVALDEPKQSAPPKKRGMLSRIMDGGESNKEHEKDKGTPWHHFGGRKRGQSGQGAELGSIPKREEMPKAESALRKEEVVDSQQEQQQPQIQVQPPATQQTSQQQQPQIQVQPPATQQTSRPESLKQAQPIAESPTPPEPQQASAGAEKESTQAPVTVNGAS